MAQGFLVHGTGTQQHARRLYNVLQHARRMSAGCILPAVTHTWLTAGAGTKACTGMPEAPAAPS